MYSVLASLMHFGIRPFPESVRDQVKGTSGDEGILSGEDERRLWCGGRLIEVRPGAHEQPIIISAFKMRKLVQR